MTNDPVGNVLTSVERNGDQLRMRYDELNRLNSCVRLSATGGPQWALGNTYDSRGNRTALEKLPVYGVSRYGQARYAVGEPIFTAGFNALNQMTSLQDGQGNLTGFGFDVDGRLAEVNHPTPGLLTRHRYDLVGKLLESQVALSGNPLWTLGYAYNLSGDRLRQTSTWADGGNTFEYELDDSGRLVQESINRFVVNSTEAWAGGRSKNTRFDVDGKLRMVSRADDFQAPYLDLQRWELALSEPVATGVQIRQNQGLTMATSTGDTLRNGRHMPPGTPIDSSNQGNDYPYLPEVQVSDNVGWLDGRMLLRHRVPLVGAFDIQVSISEFDLFECSIGLGVTRDRFETANGASRFPIDLGGTVSANGCDIVVQKATGFLARFNATNLPGVTVTKLRLRRFLDGSDWKLQAFYHDGSDWVTDGAWTAVVDDQLLYAYLHLSGKVGHLRWSDFVDAVGPAYPVSTGDVATWPVYESKTYDAGHRVDWTRIAWTETLPTNTDLRFQVAGSESEVGPWSYVGPDGTSGTYFSTAAGEAISSVTGRYGRFRAFVTSTDGADTPVVTDVQITHSGTSGSRVSRWSYDAAGNITEQRVITDAGVEVDERTYNDLNQIVNSSGGWTFTHDMDGNLVEKSNGTAVGNEKWEFTWDENSRLLQVKKGVYSAGAVLVNEFTVNYRYDEAGRMLFREVVGEAPTIFKWDGWDLVSETAGSSVTEYLVPQGVICGFIRDGECFSLHSDAMGSVRLVTKSDGDVVAQREFGAWGELLDGSFSSVGSSIGFVGNAGLRTDPSTGLIYVRKRWYSPQFKRFISRDDVRAQNRYLYCVAAPQDLVDVDGFEPSQPTGGDPVGGGIFRYAPHSYHNYGPGPKARIIPAPSTWIPPIDQPPCPTSWACGGPSPGVGSRSGQGSTVPKPSSPSPLPLKIWQGYGPGLIPRAKNVTGWVWATPANVRQALVGGGYDIVMLNAHHYPDGQGIKVNGGWVHIGELLREIPEDKWPRLIILNGCDTRRSLPTGKMSRTSSPSIVYSDDLMVGNNNLNMQTYYLDAVKRGATVEEAIQRTARSSSDSYIEQHFKVWGRKNRKL